MAEIAGTYVSTTTFTTPGDFSEVLSEGRKVRANCGADGYRVGAVDSATYNSETELTTVTLDSAVLTSNFTGFQYGISDVEALPVHGHADLSSALSAIQNRPYASLNLSATATNVTGDGTSYRVAYDTVLADNRDGWDATNHQYVIPEDGLYLISAIFGGAGLLSTHTRLLHYVGIASSFFQFFFGNPAPIITSGGMMTSGAGCAALSEGDVVYHALSVSNGTKVVGVTTATMLSIARVA
jgi:hypothetical protein